MKKKIHANLPVLLIDNYDSFTFNLYQLITELGNICRVVRNNQIDVEDIDGIKPKAIVLSPGPGSPDQAGICLEIIQKLSGIYPVLGVCLGHQAIAQAFGGKVVHASRVMHGKISSVHHSEKGLYHGVRNPFQATRYHSLIVERKSLPTCLKITSETKEGVIMGIKHVKYKTQGVQFHPESMMTFQGKDIVKNFLEGR